MKAFNVRNLVSNLEHVDSIGLYASDGEQLCNTVTPAVIVRYVDEEVNNFHLILIDDKKRYARQAHVRCNIYLTHPKDYYYTKEEIK